MIYTRKINNIEIDRSSTPSFYTLALYIWKGDKNSPPTEAEYSITKENVGSLSTPDYINISPLIDDFIESSYIDLEVGLNNYNDVVWCKYEIYYNNATSPSLEVVDLCLRGYRNKDNKILLDGSELSMYDSFIVPFLSGNDISVKSFPNSEINEVYSVAVSDLSNEQVKHLLIEKPVSDKYIRVSIGSESIYIYIENETKFKNNNVSFINSFGAIQLIPFYSKRVDSVSVNKETYKKSNSINNHNYLDYNINGRKSLKLNSNFHSENTNECFESLLMSGLVWVNNLPVNIKNSNITYKNRVNDKLISYEFSFDSSEDVIKTF